MKEAEKAKVVVEIVSLLPTGWDPLLFTLGQQPSLSAAKQRKRSGDERAAGADRGDCHGAAAGVSCAAAMAGGRAVGPAHIP